MVVKERGENATIVAYGNAVPRIVLYRGKFMKLVWTHNLPTASVCHMIELGSMTTAVFRD